MSHQRIATCLNDHLAGAEGALALLGYLENGDKENKLNHFATELRVAIEEDRQKLESLMATLGIIQSSPRKMAAWLMEKMTELKLHIDDPTACPLRARRFSGGH